MGEPEDQGRAGPTSTIDLASTEPCNWETPTDRLDDPITRGDVLFVRNNGLWPAVINPDPDAWGFELDGEVERPMSLSVTELRTRFDRCRGRGLNRNRPNALRMSLRLIKPTSGLKLGLMVRASTKAPYRSPS